MEIDPLHQHFRYTRRYVRFIVDAVLTIFINHYEFSSSILKKGFYGSLIIGLNHLVCLRMRRRVIFR